MACNKERSFSLVVRDRVLYLVVCRGGEGKKRALMSLIAIGIVVCLLLAVGFFAYRHFASQNKVASATTVLNYGPKEDLKDGKVPSSKLWDADGAPRLCTYGRVTRLLYGPGNYNIRETLETLRRNCLIPVDLSKTGETDKMKILTMHPKRYAAKIDEMVEDDMREWFRNSLLAVFLERCLVNPPTAYEAPGKVLMAPLQSSSQMTAALYAQLVRTPHDAAKDSAAFTEALRCEDNRTRMIAIMALTLLAFPRDKTPVSLKIKDMVKLIDLDAVLSCSDVYPWAYETFEKLLQLRSPAGQAQTTDEECAEEAVKRGFAHAVAAQLLSPTIFPLPQRSVPVGAVEDLIVCSLHSDEADTLADQIISSALADGSAVFCATVDRLLQAAGTKVLKSTARALKQVSAKVQEGVVDEQYVASAQERIRGVSGVAEKPAEPEQAHEAGHEDYPGQFEAVPVHAPEPESVVPAVDSIEPEPEAFEEASSEPSQSPVV